MRRVRAVTAVLPHAPHRVLQQGRQGEYPQAEAYSLFLQQEKVCRWILVRDMAA